MSFLKKYISSYQHYFWNWEDGGEVLATTDGSTIAYFESVKKILTTFIKQPVPHFGSLLLVIIALNENLTDVLSKVAEDVKRSLMQGESLSGGKLAILKEAIQFLKILESLPANYKSSENKILIIHMLFQQVHNTLSVKESGHIITELVRNNSVKENADLLIGSNTSFPDATFVKEFRAVALLLKKFPNVDSIKAKLNDHPDFIETLLVDDKQEGVLEEGIFSLLTGNPKTFQIGALVPRIWSGLNIPYKMNLPSGQPLGGISDLTNKGDFDKLLISEFANDDLVFLSRLANQESLYLRREQPPAADQYERIILIDISIKNWGIPKVIAYAVMTAIANHPKTNVHCTAFAIGDRIFELNAYDADQIAANLQHVDLALNAAKGLQEFLADKKAKRNTEILYVSNAESTQFPEMFKLLNDYHFLFKYWINVERDGAVKVYKNQYKSKRLIQSIQLPLEQLWSKPPTPKKEPTEIKEGVFPMLSPLINNPVKKLQLSEDKCFMIYKGAGILEFNGDTKKQKGLRFLYEIGDFHKSHKYVIGALENGDVVLLNYIPSRKEIRFFNLSVYKVETMYFNLKGNSRYPEFFFYDEKFLFMNYLVRWEFTFTDKWRVEKFEQKNEKYWQEIYETGQELQPFPSYWLPGTFLKKLKAVSINRQGNLSLSIHELTKDKQSGLSFNVNNQQEIAIQAEMEAQTVFKFRDSSKIEIKPAGILVFESANPNIETFYIPSFLQQKLAIATKTRFGGNDFYYDDMLGNEKVDLMQLYNELLIPFINQIKTYESNH